MREARTGLATSLSACSARLRVRGGLRGAVVSAVVAAAEENEIAAGQTNNSSICLPLAAGVAGQARRY